MSTSSAGNQSENAASRAGLPRWVKVFLIVAGALVVLLAAAMLIGGGQHGPSRHLSSTANLGSADAPATSAAAASQAR